MLEPLTAAGDTTHQTMVGAWVGSDDAAGCADRD